MFKGDKGGVDGGIRRNFVVVDEWEWRYMIQQTRERLESCGWDTYIENRNYLYYFISQTFDLKQNVIIQID